MKHKYLRSLIMGFIAVFQASMSAQELTPEQWIHIYPSNGGVESHKLSDIKDIGFVGMESDGGISVMTINAADGTLSEVSLYGLDHWTINNDVPVIRINTLMPVDDISSKEDYLEATVTLIGNGIVDDFPKTAVNIRGRGNSTWKPEAGIKLPYRLKFAKKQSLGALKKAKNFVLLANYYDQSIMRNALGMKLAQLLNIPYANTMIPVDVYLNDVYKGSYTLTEKVGINSGSVDVDETSSILFELDTEMDEAYVFQDNSYGLPVMVKDPDLTDETFALWKEDFSAALAKVRDGKTAEAFDIKDLANYLIMNSLVGNDEIRTPRSVYIHKTFAPAGDGLYHFGPAWDFDLSFGVLTKDSYTEFRDPKTFLICPTSFEIGATFWIAMLKQQDVRNACRAAIDNFVNNGCLEELLEYFDAYARHIEATSARDMTAERVKNWRTNETTKDYLPKLRQWIIDRVEFVSTHKNFGIY